MTFRTSAVAVCRARDFAQLAKQPGVFNRDNCLSREILYDVNLFVGKRSYFSSVNTDDSD